jgi:hypothetical protein
MDLREVWWEFANWINLAQGRDKTQALMNTEMNLRGVS